MRGLSRFSSTMSCLISKRRLATPPLSLLTFNHAAEHRLFPSLSLIHTHKERVLKKGPAAGGRRASGFLDARCCSDKARVCVSRGVMQFHRSFLSGQITGLEPLLCFTSHTPSAPWQRAATMLGSDRKSSSSRFRFLAAGLSSNNTVSFSSVES